MRDQQATRELQGANADKLQSLLLRLGPYGQDGTLAHIADRATTVADDAPVVLFDFTGLSDRLAPALTLAVADFVEWRVHQLRRRRVTGELHGPWAGRAQLIIEEGWKPLSSPAAGAWLNEYARRARHYALWLTFITQFFRDFDSEQGRALLSNHAVALCLPNERRDLELRPRHRRAHRHRYRRDRRLAVGQGRVLHPLHGLRARARSGAHRARRTRVLDRVVQPRDRPAAAPPGPHPDRR